METTKQPIEAGSLISSIANMFFKGLNKIFDDAAEYEEEMGVLKQVTRIPIENKYGDTFFIRIKLSPIKGKNGYFYVEADSDTKDLDVSSINKKVIRLNSKTTEDLRKKVDELLASQGFEKSDTKESDSEEEKTDDNTSEEAQPETFNEITEKLKRQYPAETVYDENGTQLELVTDVEGDESSKTVNVTLTLNDADGQLDGGDGHPHSYDLDFNNNSYSTLIKVMNKEHADYMKTYNLSTEKPEVSSSTKIKASFYKDSKTGEVSLTKIIASNILDAMDLVYSVSDDDDFVDALPDDVEQAYEIIDEGDDIDVEQIEDFDVSSTYESVFRTISELANEICSLKWVRSGMCAQTVSSIDSVSWDIQSAVDYLANLIMRNTDKFPAVVSSVIELPTYPELKDETGHVSWELIDNKIAETCQSIVDTLEAYVINMKPEEQSRLYGYIDAMKEKIAGYKM